MEELKKTIDEAIAINKVLYLNKLSIDFEVNNQLLKSTF